MARRFLGLSLALAIAFFLGIPTTVVAQPEVPPIEREAKPGVGATFNFFPPGARAMGMGGTFIAIADDATASEANPAGLIILSKPEVSAHFRLGSLKNEFPNYNVSPQVNAVYADTFFSPSFFSFVYPFTSAAVSFYYHQQSNFIGHAQFANRLDLRDPGDPEPILFLFEDQSRLELRSDNFGVSGAVKLGEAVAVGGSIRVTRLEVKSDLGFAIVSEEFPENISIDAQETVSDDARATTFNAGVLVNPSGRFSVGLTYKQGKDMALNLQTVTTACLPCGTLVVDSLPILDFGPPEILEVPQTVELPIPSALGLGLAFRPTENWVFGLDLSRITYGDAAAVNPLQEPAIGSLAIFSEGGVEPIEDATEFHLGVEYTWLRRTTPIGLRAGIFTDPDHDGITDVDSNQVHLTFGAGAVLGQLQFDAAVNIADSIQEVLFSFVYRLP